MPTQSQEATGGHPFHCALHAWVRIPSSSPFVVGWVGLDTQGRTVLGNRRNSIKSSGTPDLGFINFIEAYTDSRRQQPQSQEATGGHPPPSSRKPNLRHCDTRQQSVLHVMVEISPSPGLLRLHSNLHQNRSMQWTTNHVAKMPYKWITALWKSHSAAAL